MIDSKSVTISGKILQVYVLEGETTGINVHCVDNVLEGIFKEVWWYALDLGAVVHYKIKWDFPNVVDDFKYTLKKITISEDAKVQQSLNRP